MGVCLYWVRDDQIYYEDLCYHFSEALLCDQLFKHYHWDNDAITSVFISVFGKGYAENNVLKYLHAEIQIRGKDKNFFLS